MDQVQYLSTQLEPERFSERIDVYFEMRSRRALSDSKGETLPELRIEARHVYKTLLYLDDQQRADIQARLQIVLGRVAHLPSCVPRLKSCL